ncbi:uncharacterized protein E0L32_009016 [Thyridium curvatum]|uniref:Uncharacterized protein n=1 Tax=Thyridium curvatum TaxID=1093900 RepID=A0A507AI89_9PEZI|nr:uncharacterized protein E0L32_009016 [Thyridium curvatum]TPX09825.1 hypothetical protein E0L32_009016 [Thyridium curvatum]
MPELQTEALHEPASGEEPAVPVHFENSTRRGQKLTVARDAEGKVAYPAYIPPETQSPDAKSPSPLTAGPPLPDKGPRKAISDPAKLETELDKLHKAGPTPRPKYEKKFATDAPRPRRRSRGSSVAFPAIKRAGTNASQLQQALWTKYGEGGDDSSTSSSSSSSSSSEDEGEGDAKKGPPAGQKKERTKSGVLEDKFSKFKVGNEHYRTKGKVSKRDGRLAISVKDMSNTGYLAKALGAAVRKVVPLKEDSEAEAVQGGKTADASTKPSTEVEDLDTRPCPRLNIVIMVIGSRGDAQPFLKIGKVLKEQYGHRVRIATHPAFREFVEKDSGLDFFSVGGDPSELMAFMVKNPGMIPTLETVKAGDIGRRRAAMAEMFEGFWRACVNATDDEKDTHNLKMMGEKDPFIADAIIANPPSFAHIHCAEALGIPLHLMFTFPYTPTQAFPHPLASIKKSNVDPGYTNFISYPLVEMMVWQGLGDLVNEFREKTLGLDPVSTLWAPGATYRLHVPFTYMWSPGLVPKPEDWGSEIDVSGFVFLDLASTFEPPSDLEKFLAAGETPIYIGFGSIVVDDADRFTEMIFEAVEMAGVRALVSKGWGGLGGENVPENIFMLENTPHDWLFPKVKACVIHGGAGTTAIALKCGKPTMVVPFFGDQHFWGSMISNAGAGPEPIPYKQLTAETLAEGIEYCLSDEAKEAAEGIAHDIEEEGDGAENACKAFHKHLMLTGKNSMRCSILEDHVAHWHLKGTRLRLSAIAADAIVEKGHISWKKLRLIRHCEWNDFEGPGEPVTGIAGSIATSLGNVFGGIGGVPYRLAKSSNERKERKEKKRKAREVRAQKKKEARAAAQKSKDEARAKQNGQPLQPAVANGKPPEAKDFASADKLPRGQQQQQTTEGALQNDEAETASIHTTSTTDTAETEEENPAEEFVAHVGKGVGKSAQALARAPVDLSLAVAQGFHNAPRLYGDDTVRRPPRVTGIRSGLKAARYEFVYGVYDGWTGLVRLPVRGARGGGGVRGFAKGVGMGVTGFVLKDIAALVGPVGYTLKGCAKQVGRRGRQGARHVRRARILQGQRELRLLPREERAAVVAEVERGWGVMRELAEAVEDDGAGAGPGAGAGASGGRSIMRTVTRGHRKRGVGQAVESVGLAEEALAAVRRGESIDGVVKARRSEDAGARSRRSVDASRKHSQGQSQSQSSHDMGRDPDDARGKGKGPSVTEPIAEQEEEEQQGGKEVNGKAA